MSVIRLTGNVISLNSTSTVVPLANSYLANNTSGASQVYVYNGGVDVANLMLNNSEGSFVFAIPPSTEILLNKVSTDTINTAASGVTVNPVQCSPT